MTALYALLMGIIQGVIEFLPVSSSGHLILIEKLMGFPASSGLLFETLLHTAVLVSLIRVFRKDIGKIMLEFLAVCADILWNFRRYLQNRHRNEPLPYRRIVTSVSRKLTVLLILSAIPTFLIGYAAKNLAELSKASDIMTSIGILMTGVVLLVADLGSTNTGKKGIASVSYDQAMWLGICQGISVFPGISRLGLTLSLSQIYGYKASFAVRYSFLMSVPAILGATIAELGHFTSGEMYGALTGAYVLGMLAAGITAYFTIRVMLRLLQRIRLRYFAFYCFLIGAVSLIHEYM